MRRIRLLCLGLAVFLAGVGGLATDESSAQTGSAMVPPAIGTTFVTRSTNHQDKSVTERTWTVVEATYKGRKVIGFSDGVDTVLHNPENRNWFMTLRGDAERASATPHDGQFSWPLEVGKAWTATYMYYDGVTRRTFNPIVTYWKAAAYEDVTVPAGTFKAFRLESTPGTNNSTSVTVWYAPEVRLIVKRIREQTSRHYLGAGTFTMELIRVEK